jgi:rod shape-determining protein MreC
MYKLFRIINTYKDYFIFVALMIISVSLISVNSSNKMGGFRTVVAATFGNLRNLFSWIPDINGLKNENQELMNMNTQFFNEVTSMRKAIQENDELRRMLNMQKSYKYPLIVCDVYDKNSIQLRNYVVLNKGKLSEVEVGMPVISLKGLVGSVIGCSDNYSIVETINSKNVKIPATLSKSKFNGIVAWNNSDYLNMLYVSKSANVKIGEEVYTSVINSTYHEDILIGRVIEVAEEPGSYFHKIVIKPANPFFEYRQLFVVKYIKDAEVLKLIKETENRLLNLKKLK